MFVRKKKNRSGSISVVVVSKAHGKFTEVKHFGVVTSDEEAESLCLKAKEWIKSYGGQQQIGFDNKKGLEIEEAERFISNIDNVLINGTQ